MLDVRMCASVIGCANVESYRVHMCKPLVVQSLRACDNVTQGQQKRLDTNLSVDIICLCI